MAFGRAQPLLCVFRGLFDIGGGARIFPIQNLISLREKTTRFLALLRVYFPWRKLKLAKDTQFEDFGYLLHDFRGMRENKSCFWRKKALNFPQGKINFI